MEGVETAVKMLPTIQLSKSIFALVWCKKEPEMVQLEVSSKGRWNLGKVKNVHNWLEGSCNLVANKNNEQKVKDYNVGNMKYVM